MKSRQELWQFIADYSNERGWDQAMLYDRKIVVDMMVELMNQADQIPIRIKAMELALGMVGGRGTVLVTEKVIELAEEVYQWIVNGKKSEE